MSINIGQKGEKKLMATMLNVSQRVKDARCDANLTQTELGRKIGKSKQWVSELERGNIRLSYENGSSYFRGMQ